MLTKNPRVAAEGTEPAVCESYDGFRTFIEDCRRIGEVVDIEGADWDLEIGTLTEAAAENLVYPPMILFDGIKGYPRVVAALVEEAKNSLRSLAPRAVSTVREVLETFDPKARLKAADMILSRTDVVVSRVEGKIEHEIIDRTQQSIDYLAHLIARGASEQMLLNEFGPGGLDRYRKLLEARERAKEVVDAEYTVIEEKPHE